MKSRNGSHGSGGDHAVHFYSDEGRLCTSVADFLADGIARRQPILIIATPEHRRRIANSLLKRQFDLDDLVNTGSITLLDAEQTLEQFMVNDVPDAPRFREVIGTAIDRVSRRNAGGAIRAYGEMVDVLWKQGKCEAAVQVELLWNELAETHAFSLLCGYAMGNFFKEASRQLVLSLHTHLHA